MPNTVNLLLLTLALVASGASKKLDVFSKVHCGSDILKALIGRYMPNERVVVIEARHKDLGLKDLGAEEISENLSVISWLICGNEYMLLEDKKNIVRDVLKVPPHSKDSPLFIGICQVNGREMTDVIVAILKNEQGTKMLSAITAWRINEKAAKFVVIPTAGLQCSRDYIVTSDGGP